MLNKLLGSKEEIHIFKDLDKTPEYIASYNAAFDEPNDEKIQVAEIILSQITPPNSDYLYAAGYYDGYKAAMRARAGYPDDGYREHSEITIRVPVN